MAISDVQVTVRGAGFLIKELREKKDLQAKDLAARAEIDPSVLSRIENNVLGMSTEVLTRIAGALGMPPIKLARMCLDRVQRFSEE